MNITKAQHAWSRFQNQVQIKRPTTEGEYLELQAFMDELTSRYAMSDPVWEPLIDLVARYMLEWENANDSWAQEPATPRDVVANLMRDRNVTQVQLEKAGVIAQSTLSQILNRKRQISKTNAKKLAAYFQVSSALLI